MRTVMNLVAPSPSRTMACASCTDTATTASRSARPSADASDSMRAWPARCVAISTNESLVDVSPSTVMRLKLASAASRTSDCNARRRDHRVGGDEAQHRRHVGSDHAGALGDAADRDRAAIDRKLSRRRLGQRVGGHDAFGRIEPGIGLERAHCRRQAGLEAVDRQRFHDHAGRERQHLPCLHADQAGQRFAAAPGTGQAIGAGAGVGVAGIDHQRADIAARGEVLAAQLHRGRAKAVAGEHARRDGPFVEREHHQVFAIGLADARHGDADAQAWHGVQVGGTRNGQIDGHARAPFKPADRGSACTSCRCRMGTGRCGPPWARWRPALEGSASSDTLPSSLGCV